MRTFLSNRDVGGGMPGEGHLGRRAMAGDYRPLANHRPRFSNHWAYWGIKGLLIVTAFLLVSSCEGAMAHKTEKPHEKPTQEKPAPDVPTPDRPTTPTPDRAGSGPNPEANACVTQQRDAKGQVITVTAPECRHVAPPTAVRVRPPVVVQYPPPFLPLPQTPYVVRDSGPITLQVTHGKPEVKTYSTCHDQGKPRDCRVRTVAVVKPPVVTRVVKTAPKPAVKKAQPKRKMQLPFGR